LIKRERNDVFGYGVIRLVAGDGCVSHSVPFGNANEGLFYGLRPVLR
jgi:hypothetical protein